MRGQEVLKFLQDNLTMNSEVEVELVKSANQVETPEFHLYFDIASNKVKIVVCDP